MGGRGAYISPDKEVNCAYFGKDPAGYIRTSQNVLVSSGEHLLAGFADNWATVTFIQRLLVVLTRHLWVRCRCG